MRKIALAAGIVIGMASQMTAQDTQITWGMVSSSVEKSDEAVQHDKKKLKVGTWLERERVYTRLYYYDLNGVMPGTEGTQLALLKQGEPASKETKDGVEIWKYDRIDFLIKDGKVIKWEFPNAFRENPLMTSVEALQKAEELDEAGKKADDIKEKAKNLSTYLRIAGSMEYGTENYKEALKYFEAVISLNDLKSVGVVDTVLYNDCGVVAKIAGENEKAIQYMLKAADIGYKSDILYGEVSVLYQELGDTAAAISVLEKGIEKFKSPNMINEMINIYLSTGKNEEALAYLDKAIESEPNNATYYFAKGALYDQINNSDASIEAYIKAIEIDPKYTDAYLNLGASYYNKGINHFQLANDAKSDKVYEAEKAKAEEQYKKAMPYLEKIIELNPEDVQTLKNAVYSLKNIYYKLGMYKESKAMKEKYETL